MNRYLVSSSVHDSEALSANLEKTCTPIITAIASSSLFDAIQFPRETILDRSFADRIVRVRRRRNRKDRVMSDKALLNKHGDIGTFILRVQQRQYSTWQGRITWVEEDKTTHFRSMLEMIKLIESGLAAENPEMLEEQPPTWEGEK